MPFIEILRSEGLVVEDAVVLMHRQQGAEEILTPEGIRLHRLGFPFMVH